MITKIGVRSHELPKTIEIEQENVYRHFNIKEGIDIEEHHYYEYDEEQYSLTEYLSQVVPQLEMAIAELTTLVAGGDSNV